MTKEEEIKKLKSKIELMKEAEESTSNSENKTIDYNFPRFERSELIDTSQTQIFN